MTKNFKILNDGSWMSYHSSYKCLGCPHIFLRVSLLIQQHLKEAVVQVPLDLSLPYKLLIACEPLMAHLYINSLHLILNLAASVQVKSSHSS